MRIICRLAASRYGDGSIMRLKPVFSGTGGGLARQPKVNASDVSRASGWVLVTGASAGIGRELGMAFASRGYDLILAARN